MVAQLEAAADAAGKDVGAGRKQLDAVSRKRVQLADAHEWMLVASLTPPDLAAGMRAEMEVKCTAKRWCYVLG
jgi:hypothetical protein